MPIVRTFARSFSGGVLTPEFYGQIADAKFQTGLAKCINTLISPHGPAMNRQGTVFVREVKDSSKLTRLISFSYSTTQTMVLEVGEGYIRFHTQGATLTYDTPAAYNGATAYAVGDLVSHSGANYYCVAATTGNAPPNTTYWYALPMSPNIYEIPTPYAEEDLFDIHFVQSQDILTLVHPNYAPRTLNRNGATNWTLPLVAFASDLAAPTGPTAVASVGSGSTTYNYKITAVGPTGLEEGPASANASCTNDLLTSGNYNTISWSAVAGATRHNVYKQSNGLYGYIGQTESTSFRDENITADVSKTPPIQNNPFTSPGAHPGAVSYFEQRKFFGGTLNQPQNLWATQSGTESNLSYHIPSLDDDAIQFRIAAREANTIRHLVPLTSLIILTSSAEWGVTSVNTDALTPTSFSVKPQSYIGASNVQPVIVNNNLIYAAARGGHVREMAYTWQANGYLSGDLSLRAPHLFDGYEIIDMAYVKAPYPIIWLVSSSGDLLGLTYVPEQQIGAWHQHTTDGSFESCATVAEGSEDILYAIVKRTIDGNEVRYIERFRSRAFSTLADAYFVDCGIEYSGSPISTISSGLEHLVGKTVSILADGAVSPPQVVNASGGLDDPLEVPASKIKIGLPITADIQTLPLVFETQAYGQGRQKNVNKVWIRVNQSSGIFAGPSFDDLDLVEAKQRTDEPYGTPPRLQTREVPIMVKPSWGDNGSLCIRQQDPLPLTVVSLTLEVAIGG